MTFTLIHRLPTNIFLEGGGGFKMVTGDFSEHFEESFTNKRSKILFAVNFEN